MTAHETPEALARRAVHQKNLADPALVFLALAATNLYWVEEGERDIDDAIDALIPAFERLRPCTCAREIIDRLSQPLPHERRRRAA